MKTRIAATLLLLGSPAAAQDLVYSDEATRACLVSAPDAIAQEACIGASARACMRATPFGGSTAGSSGCLDKERAYLDGLLNAYYQTAINRARQMDGGSGARAQDPASVEGALRAMQRAWIVFRDTSCDFEASQWGGGTGTGPAFLGCLMEMTGKQALKLGRFGVGQG